VGTEHLPSGGGPGGGRPAEQEGGATVAQIKKTGESVNVTRVYQVTGVDRLQRPYGGLAIKPNKVTVTFLDGKWRILTAEGPRLLKDGSAGTTLHEVSYSHYSESDLPDWAMPLIKY
jgi:hypothetical protein